MRSELHARGFRFRLHDRRLPGKPDIVLPKWRVVVEVRGCFWHRHHNCRFATTPATRPEFWLTKFAANVDRDRDNIVKLISAGWRVAIIWECVTRLTDITPEMDLLAAWIRSGGQNIQIPELLHETHAGNPF